MIRFLGSGTLVFFRYLGEIYKLVAAIGDSLVHGTIRYRIVLEQIAVL